MGTPDSPRVSRLADLPPALKTAAFQVVQDLLFSMIQGTAHQWRSLLQPAQLAALHTRDTTSAHSRMALAQH